MARTAREVQAGLPHHLIHRGNNRRRLFSFASDYGTFLRYVEEALRRCACLLHTIVLMSNHVHLIVTPPGAEALAGCVKRFAQRYALYRNRKRAGSGKLFEERYHSVAITSDEQLAVTMAYCDLNPERSPMRCAPERYEWSSAGLWLGDSRRTRVPARMLTPPAYYLGLGATSEERERRYREWVDVCRRENRAPKWKPRIDQYEAASFERYSRRLERPDRSRARDREERYG